MMKNLKAKLNKQGGFTLIEMLIVIAIIAILIAIAIPAVNKALESAREATDAANERSALGIAMVEVMSENKLAGQEIKGDDPITVYYVMESIGDAKGSGMGVLSTTAGPGYGKGTGAGEVTESHVNQVVTVTYDPKATDPDKAFVIDWADGGKSASSPTP